jgi:hypothetical protein
MKMKMVMRYVLGALALTTASLNASGAANAFNVLPADPAKRNCLAANYELYAERRHQNDRRTDSWKNAGALYNQQRFNAGVQRCLQ